MHRTPLLSKWVASYLAANPPIGAFIEAFGPFLMVLFTALFALWVWRRCDAHEQAEAAAAPKAAPPKRTAAKGRGKRCTMCGQVHDETSWAALPCLGEQVDHDPDGTLAMRLELRNCQCGTTLCINLLAV